jgi:lactoylglutathione lyase
VTPAFVHTCVRVRDLEASLRFYGALGFEERGRLNFASAFNVYLGLPGGGDVLELTVNDGRAEPYDLGDGYGLADSDGYRIELIDGPFPTPQDPPRH